LEGKEGWLMAVYFIGDGHGRVKIGCSSNPAGRLGTLQTGTALPLRLLCSIIGGREQESFLHNWFREDRIAGEWFKQSHRLAGFIETAIDSPGADPQWLLEIWAETEDARHMYDGVLYEEHAWSRSLQGRPGERPEAE
jgi:hypothetical protein